MIKKHPFRIITLVVVLISTTFAQPSVPTAGPQSPTDRVALYQALLDLTNPWTVMCIAAHPDDEDGTSLVVMRRKYGAHTVSLFSTFGEGGQNAIGPELYEEMGAIRARETMAASEIQGSEPYFLGLKDFGFSKSADETFQKWGHEEALRRMVLQIRKLRPDVIITNHSVTSNDHGHHQATARLAVEAFDAAADSKRFPEQLKVNVTTWQVQRLFVRVRGNQTLADNPVIVTIDPNEKDPVRGVSFAEQALSALQKHATQGPWPKSVAQLAARFTNSTDGRLPLVRYRLAREAKGANPLEKDAKSFVTGLSVPNSIAKLVVPKIDGRPLTEFVDDPDLVFDTIGKAVHSGTFRPISLSTPSDPPDTHLYWVGSRTNSARALASGIRLSLAPKAESAVRGSRASFVITIANNGRRTAQIQRLMFYGLADVEDLKTQNEIKPGETVQVEASEMVPVDYPLSIPRHEHLYDGRFIGGRVSARLTVAFDNDTLTLEHPLFVDIAPALEIADISPSPVVVRKPQVGVSSAGTDILPTTPPKVNVKLVNRLNRPFKGELAFGQENRSPESRRKIEIPSHETISLTITVPVREHSRPASTLSDKLWFSLRKTGLHENLIKRSVPVVWANARVNRKVKVGYVRGFDFSLPNALDALGVESKELTIAEVKTADLSGFTSFIVDNRVYESQPELIAANQKLLDFANNGGTLIVFYHKSDEWNPDPRRNRPQLAPYKLIVGNERITDENAPISFLEPDHALLNSPNKLGQEDFVGWIQERGVNYPREWDTQFHALLQSNDPGEAPLKGGLLVADHGKGRYIYSSMVWYRQLRAGIPGAYRMLANMISYGQETSRR